MSPSLLSFVDMDAFRLAFGTIEFVVVLVDRRLRPADTDGEDQISCMMAGLNVSMGDVREYSSTGDDEAEDFMSSMGNATGINSDEQYPSGDAAGSIVSS